MSHVALIGKRYYFNRRVPAELREYDPRSLVRQSLKTDSKEIAQRKAIIFNDHLETYWKSLIEQKRSFDSSDFRRMVLIARQMGFVYQTTSVVAALPTDQLIDRLLLLQGANKLQVQAALGAPRADLTLRDVPKKFMDLTKDKVMNKTESQWRKWKNPREKAIDNLVKLCGNKSITALDRSDLIALKDWWITGIQKGKSEASANKQFVHLKVMLETVSDHEKLGLDIAQLFKKIKFQTRFKQVRKPFTPDQIRTILHSPKLQNMNEEGRWFLYAMSETGARPSELAGLQPEDIRLDESVPHIVITDRKDRPLKTPHSEREIPLVGYALEAFQAMPNGFVYYRDRVDSMTTAVNKFLRENDLMPSDKHTVYSLRHSFQDRILSVDTPDRIQAELMGHKFHRPKYGDGGTLKHKKEWLDKICLKQMIA